MILNVLTEEGIIVDAVVDEVHLPGICGEMDVREMHTFFITVLCEGKVSYRSGDEEKVLYIGGGLAEISDDVVTVIANKKEVSRLKAVLEEGVKAA